MSIQEKATKLADLVSQFHTLYTSGTLDISSEATARSWIEDLLKIFGWNSKDPYEVDQEVHLGDQEVANMETIGSKHRRPDYLLCAKSKSLVFIDAKNIGLNLKDNKKASFQIRSYGWSSGHSYAVVTSFKELAIYDCRFKPNKEQEASVARVFYSTYDKFVDNFSPLYNHLDKEYVLSGLAFDPYKLEERPNGTLTLDEDFSEHIREWRLKVANAINSSIRGKTVEFISEKTQLLIDRIIFCRVAEGLNIVDRDKLLSLVADSNSWEKVKSYFDGDCLDRFGGLLFGEEKAFGRISIPNTMIQEFVESLYYPNPYRFDVITPVLLGNIYERYLGRKLDRKNNRIVDDFKEEYQKTKGAVYTPDYIVRSVCNKVLSSLVGSRTFAQCKDLKILDPSCGSGSFLLGAFDFLSDSIIEKFVNGKVKKTDEKYFWVNPRTGKSQLRVFAKREIINQCIYGVDIDPQAVDIARLSLSLKALESASLEPIALRELGLLDSLMLDGVGLNIKLGNSLVDGRVFNFVEGLRGRADDITLLKPFDWNGAGGFQNVMAEGGFDAVVGNPPYIEIKHYKKHSPIMHHYLTQSEDYVSCGAGKTDIAMPFIERSVQLLKPEGRMGFIVQTRFFKTDYGESAREMLSDLGNIEEIIDFGSLKVFEKRTTYTSIMIMRRLPAENLRYVKIDNLSQIDSKLEDLSKFQLLSFNMPSRLGNEPWFFVHPDLKSLRDRMLERFGTIEQFGRSISINVGLQVLYKKVYLIRGRVEKSRVVGESYAGTPVNIEKAICRPLVVNRKFYPFKVIEKDNFALFPYKVTVDKKKQGNLLSKLNCDGIKFRTLCEEFPRAGEYLKKSKNEIQEKVATNPGMEWHLYTREQNHCLQSLPKVLVPSTCVDTTATVDALGEFYQDNVRVNSIIIDGADVRHYKALAAIFNSRIFDCLAKITAESLDNGYIQLNKQFLLPVPLPVQRLLDEVEVTDSLASVYDEMQSVISAYANASDKETREALKIALSSAEENLNSLVNTRVYELNDQDVQELQRFGKRLPIGSYVDQTLREVGELDFVEEAEAV